MNFNRIYGLLLRHMYLILSSFPRTLDLVYWPSIQLILWGFIAKFFELNSNYYSDTVGVILTAAILYDFLFRTSIGFNIMFLEEIWSRNFTNLFISPIKIKEIISSLTIAAIMRTLIGIIPISLLAVPFFGVSIFNIGTPIIFLLLNLYLFGVTLGLIVSSGLMRFGPSFENIAWATLFLLAPLGCVYYPLDILPGWLQIISNLLPLVHIFEEMRNILINQEVNIQKIILSTIITIIYFIIGSSLFYISYYSARKRGILINMGE